MLQKSGWTKDRNLFFQWLSALPFSGGGFNDVAAAEGLAEALMMFSSLKDADGQRHCILVAASNPYPLPRRVYYPAMLNLEQSDNEAHTSLRLADAETVARAFPQCSVTLSVICPRKLPKLRAIYNAGKRDQQAAAPTVDMCKNPNFLVLISENFSEACAAFTHSEVERLAPSQTLVEMDMSSVPPVSSPASTSNPASQANSGTPLAYMPVLNQQPISAGNIPLGKNNSAEANMSLSQQQTLATVPSAQSGYVKFWEGNLCMVREGQPQHILRLQGYKKSSASESSAANLPQTLQIRRFMLKDHMFQLVRECTGKADILAFWASDWHGVLNALHEKNLSAVIQLPSQTLFIHADKRSFPLIGLLLSNENIRSRPTIPNQQLRAQPPPGMQQLRHNQ
ncbi:mediator of RNA polymerase II transcription subunit 25 isoform X1 [Solanum lycopersicum]|uniref:mediator of RNA polymerase II transcription subunit 25 isoform X1 n=2 Tax=Solanum lycopersicum TaxID=4081 RepID=UPI00374A0E2D